MLFYNVIKDICNDWDVTLDEDKSIVIKNENTEIVFKYVENQNIEIENSDFYSLLDKFEKGPQYTYSEEKVNLNIDEIKDAPHYGVDENIDVESIKDDIVKVRIRFNTTKFVSDHYFSPKLDNLCLSNMEKELIKYLIFDGNMKLNENNDERFLSQFKDEIDENDVLVVENKFHAKDNVKENQRSIVSVYVVKNVFDQLGKKMITIDNNSKNYTFDFIHALRKNGFDIKEIIYSKQWLKTWDVKNIGYFEQQRVRTIDPVAIIPAYSPFTMYKVDAINDFYTLSEEEKRLVNTEYIRDKNGKYVEKAYNVLVNEGLSRELIKSLLSLRTKHSSDVSTAVYTSSLLTARNIGVKMANYRKSYMDNSKLYKNIISIYEICALGYYSDLLDTIDENVKLKDVKNLLTSPSVYSKLIKANEDGIEINSKITQRRIKKIETILQSKEKITSIINTFIDVAQCVKESNLVNIWVNDNYLNNLVSNIDNLVIENEGKFSINEDFLVENKCSNAIYYSLIEASLLDAKKVYKYGKYEQDIKLVFNLLSLFDSLLFRYER